MENNSVVVDSNGNLEVLFHGTGLELKEITVGNNEPGAWFTTDKENAMNYAKGDDPQLYRVNLSIINPLTVDFFMDFDEEENCVIIDGTELFNNVAIVEYAMSKGFDGVNFPMGNFTESNNTWVAFNDEQIKMVGGYDAYNKQ